MTTSPQPANARRDLWIPGLFIAFFVCLACLELWFVTIARTTFSGVVTDQAYDIGLNYNQVIAAREAEARLGWTFGFRFEPTGPLAGRVTLTLADKAGAPVAGAALQASSERMTRFPQMVPAFFREAAPGQYVADINVPLAGRWFVRAKATRDGDTSHVIKEIWVAP